MKTILIYFIISVAAFLASILIGAENINLREIFSGKTEYKIFFFQRVPRTLLAFFSGGSLALTGFCFQNVFQNSLATPFTTGVASGATLGAVLSLSFSSLNFSMGFIHSLQIFALAGGALSLFLILKLSFRKDRSNITRILLTGVTVSIVSSSGVIFIRSLLTPNILIVVDRWMMGGFSVSGFDELASIMPFLIPGLSLLFWQSPRLNYLISGKELAKSRGIDPDFTMKILLLAGSLVTTAVVSVAGPVAFVGLIVPHILRRIAGSDSRLLMPLCFLAGGAFLSLCDAASRIILSPTELPVGIITAFTGGVFFIWILNKSKKS
jgi:iron complex transport system permease protein